MDQEPLDALGILEGTDKTSLQQDYLRHYERVFVALRHEPIQVLEIGIAEGGSLRTWKRFFSQATIIGVDIGENCRAYADDRVKVEIGSQADPEFLAELARRYQPDIIIDDGSHQADHVMLTFDHLFPFLQPGGFYVMEDLYLHYGDAAPHWHRFGGAAPAEHFASVARRLAADHLEPDCDSAARYLWESIDRVEFVRRAIILRKKDRPEDPEQRLAYLWNLAERGKHAVNWFGLSQILMSQNQLDRAEIAAQNAVTITPRNAHYLARLAHIQAMRGNFLVATETISEAVRLEPHDPGFRAQMAHYGVEPTKP